RQAYPAMLVTAGLNDPRVGYWEPAKWVAKLRATKTDDHVLLLRTNMGAGHGGASGRYDALHEWAIRYAFILDQILPQRAGTALRGASRVAAAAGRARPLHLPLELRVRVAEPVGPAEPRARPGRCDAGRRAQVGVPGSEDGVELRATRPVHEHAVLDLVDADL